MKTSIWLTNFEKEVNEKRSQSNQKKKVIFIILPIMMALFSLPTLTSNDTLEPQVKMGILIMLGIFVFIFLFYEKDGNMRVVAKLHEWRFFL